ncbi:DUF4019 domain-containing protein [Buttiauxella sp.]|uniref:DUF4019 domain-containing protein n=1 Tax=Buttiauxella sp. TaxID=1972222 RepID=UPI003C74F2B8
MMREVNNRQYNELYEIMHPEFKAMYDKNQFITLSNNVRVPYGKSIKTTLFGSQSTKLFNPRGYALQYTYITEFPNGVKLYESPTVFAGDSKTWHPFGYIVQPVNNHSK